MLGFERVGLQLVDLALLGVQEVPSSNLGSPTKFLIDLRTVVRLNGAFWSPSAGLRRTYSRFRNSVIERGGDGNLRTILLKRYPAPQFSLVVRRMPMYPI